MTSTHWRRTLRRNRRRRTHRFETLLEVLEIRLTPHAGHGPHVAEALADAGLIDDPTQQPPDPWLEISPEGTDPFDYVQLLGEYDSRFDSQLDHEAFDAWLLSTYPPGEETDPPQEDESSELSEKPGPPPSFNPGEGDWSAVINWPHVAVHALLLPNGKVMTWPYSDDPRLWDPVTNTFSTLAHSGSNMFCSGQSLMADGRVFDAGGHIENGVGLIGARIYDSATNSWTNTPNMNAGRWYPTSTTLPNGEILVSSGNIDNTIGVNQVPQVFQTNGAWRDLLGAQLSLPLYPWMQVAPNGQVFNAGPNQNTRYLSTPASGAWSTVANRTFGFRDYGTAVIYNDGKILAVGGADPPTATAEVVDLNAATPAWRSVGSMSIARRQINGTVLPDGKVLVTGGSSAAGFNTESGAVLYAEMWDPATETFTKMATYTQYRGYHSTAILLPDGRVLSAGGDNHPTGEIFSPPYLFMGARPTITSAPSSANYGQTIFVATPDSTDIQRVSMIRLTSVTHAFNMDQRINFPAFTSTAGGVNVTMPTNANIDPQGYYMLFLVNTAGVPSVASIIKVASNDPVGTITSPAVGTLYNAGNTINYSGTGTDAEDGTLAASRFTWQVDFHHDSHIHSFVPPTTGSTSGSFTIPTTGETSANVFYRIWLTVRDSNGLTHSTFRDVNPRTATITLRTDPGALQILVDNQPITTPATIVSVVGMNRTLEAANQEAGGTYYTFQSWSDGGAGMHMITMPASNVTYTATYQLNAPYYQDIGSQGMVSLEAEHYFVKTEASAHRWTPNSTAGYSGDGAMESTPNNGANINTGYATTSPRMDFRVKFAKTGTHYIWVRGIGANGSDDSLHVGLDGAELATSDRISNFLLGTNWSWTNGTIDGPVATFDVATTGFHTVNVWMREDGLVVDKLLLTTDSAFVPSAMGPPESKKGLVWDGGGSTNNWSEAANWAQNALPQDGEYVVFDGTSTKNATVDAGFGATIGRLRMDAPYTGAITLARSLTIGSLAGTGTINLGANTLVTGGDNWTTTYSGTLNQTGGLTKNGVGSFYARGNDTYEGRTLINDGSLLVSINGALGSTLGGTTVVGGASARLVFERGVNYTSAEPVTINGSGLNGLGSLMGVGTTAFAGPIGLGSASTIGAYPAASVFTLSGALGNNGNALTLTGTGNLNLTGVIGGTGSLTKNGTGTATLSNANTYGGGTVVNAGTLLVTGSIGNATVNSGATLAGPGTVGTAAAIGGTVSPGASVGTLSGTSADFGSGGILIAQVQGYVAGTQFDRLSLSGALTMGGTSILRLDLAGLSSTGTASGVAQYASRTGTFTSVQLINNPNSYFACLSYGSTSLNVTIQTGVCPQWVSDAPGTEPVQVADILPASTRTWAAKSPSAPIAILDSGMDYTHPALFQNVRVNEREIPARVRILLRDRDGDGRISLRDLNQKVNQGPGRISDQNGNGVIDGGDILQAWSDGADGDGNGYVDDLIGWDFVNNDNDPLDDNGHGTHGAGILVDVAPRAEVLPLKMLDANAVGSLADARRALDYAVAQGISISSNGWAASTYSPEWIQSLKNAEAAGHLFVTAAGNGDPALLEILRQQHFSNVLAVGATDRQGTLTEFSNWDPEVVDLAVPGMGMVGAVPGGSQAAHSGTSVATALASGLAGMLRGRTDKLTRLDLVDAILDRLRPRAAHVTTVSSPQPFVMAAVSKPAPILSQPLPTRSPLEESDRDDAIADALIQAKTLRRNSSRM
jgi:autotransporter-associated beta strand protein